MIHSPLYQEGVEEAERKGETKGKREAIFAARCRNLAAFRKRLFSGPGESPS